VTLITTFISLARKAHKNLTNLGSNMSKLQQYLNKNIEAYMSEIQALTQDNKYDTDSYLIDVDNHTSASMTNSKQDFVGTTVAVDGQIEGIKELILLSMINCAQFIMLEDYSCGMTARFCNDFL
jgi:hypothetical protein